MSITNTNYFISHPSQPSQPMFTQYPTYVMCVCGVCMYMRLKFEYLMECIVLRLNRDSNWQTSLKQQQQRAT